MILILSQKFQDVTTDVVIDWLDHFQVPFRRLNGIDFYKDIHVEIVNGSLHYFVKGFDYSDDSVSVVWFRRWIAFNELEQMYLVHKSPDRECIDPLKLNFNSFLGLEFQDLTEAFFRSFAQEKIFTRTVYGDINKLKVLNKALELGIDIPQTYITTTLKKYQKFSEGKSLIVKPISNAPTVRSGKTKYLSYTVQIEGLDDVSTESFAPSQFQDLIEKKYEIRSFLLNRKFYSMAIFSQEDEQTRTDFRQYNDVKPNRNVPYNLPEKLEEKLLKLADSFGLSTGSFDLIKTKNNDYVFLEVNPEGQFGMVSYPCNYYLEKKLAEELIKSQKRNVDKQTNS